MSPKELPKVPVSRDFDFEWKGVSFKQVMAALDMVRHEQFHISGEILPAPTAGVSGAAAMQWVIHARLTDKRTTTWTSKPFAMNHEEVRAAADGIAQQIMVSVNPEVAGRYYMAHQNYAAAAPVFAQWLETDPNNPEPNLWLARTLGLKGDIVAAENFANRAWSEVKPVHWWEVSENQRVKKYRQAALLSMGYADERMGDFSEAEEKYRQDMDSSAGLNNLGDLELRDLHKPADAIDIFKKAITEDGSYVTARVNLARALRDTHDLVGSEAEIDKVLGMDPFDPSAMQFYLETQFLRANEAAGELYCRRWISPIVMKEVPGSPTPYTYELCARLEIRQTVPGLTKVALYLLADKDSNTSPAPPLRVETLHQFAEKICDSRKDIPTDTQNSAEDQAKAMNVLLKVLKLEAPADARGRCIVDTPASPHQHRPPEPPPATTLLSRTSAVPIAIASASR